MTLRDIQLAVIVISLGAIIGSLYDIDKDLNKLIKIEQLTES